MKTVNNNDDTVIIPAASLCKGEEMKIPKLPKWYDVYPQGTPEGDEEQRVFVNLSRAKKWSWRSVAQLAEDSKLTRERVEEILEKYQKRGLVFQSIRNDELWGYWERVLLTPEANEYFTGDKYTLAQKDKKDRVDNQIKKSRCP